MTDLIAELAEVVRKRDAYSAAEDICTADIDEAWDDLSLHAVNFFAKHHATLTRILTDDAAIRAAHHDLVIRLGEVTTELEAARKDAERYRWMRENEWDEPVVKLYDGDFDNASGETLDSAIDAAMKESGK